MELVKIGDILYNSWGYEQTNVDFYKIVGLTKSGKSAKVVKIGQKMVEGSEGFMSESVIPIPENEKGEVRTLRIRKYPESETVYVGSYWLWDGKPKYQSHYA